jgi:hypothetical protein
LRNRDGGSKIDGSVVHHVGVGYQSIGRQVNEHVTLSFVEHQPVVKDAANLRVMSLDVSVADVLRRDEGE